MSETAVRSVSVGDEEGVFTVAFETVANDGVIFQLADRVDDQDATLGMDSYSVSLASGATVYGGVADAMREELARSQLA